MSDVNKISSSSSNPYEVRIAQPGADRRQRDTTVNDQDSSKGQKQPPKPQPKKPPAEKTPQNAAMEDMLEALRQQHNLEEDFLEYNDRRKEFYRESNRQASEAYIKNLKEADENAGKKNLKEQAATEDTLSAYQTRIQDLSRAHIQKLMKQKLDDSTFKDIKRLDPNDPADPDAPDQENKKRRLNNKMDGSRLRPELSKMLESQQSRRSTAEPGQPQPEEALPEGRNMLESAISKLKNRLGGAHKEAHNKELTNFKPLLGESHNYTSVDSNQPAPIRTDLNEVQASINRARSLRAAADGTQYLPLEDSDVQQMLVENKLPVDYATVQAIKVASRRLQDSSFYFQRAVSILAHVGLGIDAETTDMVADTLRQFERYQRPSIMNKLYRFLTAKKYMQLYEQLRSQESYRQAPGQMELGEALLQGPLRKGVPALAQEQVQKMQRQAAAQGITLPMQVDEPTLKASVQFLLKELGLPASKVMVNQLAQSAHGNPLRAQALVLQLAAKRSLHPDEVSVLQQQLEALPVTTRHLPPLELMSKLGLPLPTQTQTRDQQALLNTLIRQLGLIPSQLESSPLTREAILVLQEIAERTETLQQFVPSLADAIRKQPDLWIRRLSEHSPRLKELLSTLPEKLVLTPEHKALLQKGLLLAIELPASRPRAMERLFELVKLLKSGPQTIDITPLEQPASEAQLNEADFMRSLKHWPREIEAQYPLARTAVLLLGLEGQRQQQLGQLVTRLNPLLQSQPELSLAGLEKLLPALQSSQQNPLSLQTLLSQLEQGIRADSSAQPPMTQTSSNLADNLARLAQANASLPIKPTPATGQAPASQPLAEPTPVPNTAPAPAAAESSELESLLLKQLPAISGELQAQYPLAHNAILLLGLQAQRSDLLSQLLERLNPLLSQHPEATLKQLQRLAPVLQSWNQTSAAEPQTLKHLLSQLETEILPAKTPAPQQNGPFEISEHPIERTLQRFYQQLSPKALELAQTQLSAASPATMDGFYQLHRLLGILDPGKAQILANIWEQPQSYARLAKLAPALAPVLEAIGQSPERSYLSLPTQQNQLIQALQSWFLQGRPEALQTALQHWLQPLSSQRNPLAKIKEQLAGFGLANLSESQLEEIWSLSQGSSDRIDAMAILLRGEIPLFKQNIQTVLQYIEQLPPQLRRQGVSDILLHLSPRLLQLIDRQIDQGSSLGQLNTLLEEGLPLLPENWRQVSSNPQLPDFARNLQLAELKQVLQDLSPRFSGQSAQAIEALIQGLDRLQSQMRQLNAPLPAGQSVADLKALLGVCKDLLALNPLHPTQNTPAAPLANPVQAWTQLLQGSSLREQPSLLTQLQDQISGLFYQVKTLLPKLQTRVEQPLQLITPQAEKLAAEPTDLSLLSIQQRLEHWGLKLQSPELLQQVMQLSQGSAERLDAIAVLLKGQLPLLPAHIEIVAQYVRNLPPSERFTSISKILSFLSDELIARMKQELQDQDETQRQQLLPEMEPEDAQQAESLLKSSPEYLSENSLQAARLLVKSPLPQHSGSLQAINHLLTSKHAPQQWLGPLQQLLSQMISLLPAQGATQQALIMDNLHNLLQQAMELLQPKNSQAQLGNWLMQVGSQLADVSSRIQSQIRSLGQESALEEHWLGQLLASLLGLSSWIEEQEPDKREQVRRFRAQLREHLPSLRQSFESLSLFHLAESQQGPQNNQTLTQYLPVMLQSLGYPAEILVRSEAEDAHDAGRAESEVQLLVQTHTLGQIHISLRLNSGQLKIRLGLERRETQRWLNPYLEALTQKLEDLPWTIGSIQTYVMPPELNSAPVLAHHLHRRYGRSAIQAL